MSEWESEPAASLPSRGGVASSSKTPPLVEEKTSVSKHVKVCKEQKYCQEFRQGPKSRTSVLGRASSILPDRTRPAFIA
jgi:hypothetical protein